jgi:hypothetical protein
MPEFSSAVNSSQLVCLKGPQLTKEPVREIPEEPHEPEILPDLPPQLEPDLLPEIPDVPAPEIAPGGHEPEISPSPEF